MAMTREEVHEAGALLHGAGWFYANRRAVETMWGTPLRPESPEVKEVMPHIILKILNGHMLDMGQVWDREKKEWRARHK